MKTAFLGLSLLATCMASAGGPDFCEQVQPKYTKRMTVPGKPNYFFRAFPESNLIGYAGDTGNFIFDTESEKQYSLPGWYDPVPLGENVISVPSSSDGMMFYSVKEILSGNSNPAPLAITKTLLGVYQSVGLIAKNEDQEIYGVIVAGEVSPLFQKVRVTVADKPKVEPLGKAIAICQGIDLKLPMLSKNGSEISGRDMKDGGVTKIWKIDHKTGGCEEVENLGIEAGKADFSFDGRYLAFHLQANGNGDLSFFRYPSASMSMNTYVYDRETKRLTKISYGKPGDNAYYPVFRKDGSIVYAILDFQQNALFAHVHPRDLNIKEFRLDGVGMEKELPRLLALGRIWNKKCTQQAELKTAESIIGAAISLTPAACRALVKESWNKDDIDDIGQADIKDSVNGKIKFQKDQIQRLTHQELEETCEFLSKAN